MLDDERWIAIMKESPERGLRLLMDAHMGLVYTIVRGRLEAYGSREDIDECVSDVFLAIYHQRERLSTENGSVKSLLAVIATRKAIDKYRVIQRNSVATTGISESLPFPETTEDALFAKEERRDCIEKLKNLGEPDCEILIRKYFLGQSTRAIAKDLGLKQNTVDKKVSRGLEKLRRMLGGEARGR